MKISGSTARMGVATVGEATSVGFLEGGDLLSSTGVEELKDLAGIGAETVAWTGATWEPGPAEVGGEGRGERSRRR